MPGWCSHQIRDKTSGREGAEGQGEMDGAYFQEQTENDDGSGIPMRSLSVNNLHISIDSFK